MDKTSLIVLLGAGGALVWAASAMSRQAPSGIEADSGTSSQVLTVTGNSPRGIRNKNPLNIKWSSSNNWKGQIGKDSGGFCVFSTDAYGLRAAYKILLTYKAKYGIDSIAKICRKWSPDANGLSGAYAATVSKLTGIPVNTVLNYSDLNQIANVLRGMIAVECGASYFNTWSTATVAAAFGV